MVDSPAGSSPARRKDSTTTPECKDDPSSSDSAASVLTQKKSNRSTTTMRSVSFAVSVKPPVTPGSASRPKVKSHTKHFRRRKKRKNPLSKRPIAPSTPPLSTMNEATVQAQVTANIAECTQIIGPNDPDGTLVAIFTSFEVDDQTTALSYMRTARRLGPVPNGAAGELVTELLSDICLAQAVHVLSAGHAPVDIKSVSNVKDDMLGVIVRDVDTRVVRLLRGLHHLSNKAHVRARWFRKFVSLGSDNLINTALAYVSRFCTRCPAQHMMGYSGRYSPAAISLAWQVLHRSFYAQIVQHQGDDDSMQGMDLDEQLDAGVADMDPEDDVPVADVAVAETAGEAADVFPSEAPPPVEEESSDLTDSGGEGTSRVSFTDQSVEEQAYRLFLQTHLGEAPRGASRLRGFRRLSAVDQSHIMDVLPIFAEFASPSNNRDGGDDTIAAATRLLVGLAVTLNKKYRRPTGVDTPITSDARWDTLATILGAEDQHELLQMDIGYVDAMSRWTFNIPNAPGRRLVVRTLLELWRTGGGAASRYDPSDEPSLKRRKTEDTRNRAEDADGENQSSAE